MGRRRIGRAFRPEKLRVRKRGKTVRFCFLCNQVRWFEFNRVIKHSKCTCCGRRRGRQLTDEEFDYCSKKGWIK